MDQPIRRRSLRTVFSAAPLNALDPIPPVMITGVTSDSRRVRKGYAFVAIKGENSDGYPSSFVRVKATLGKRSPT